LISLLFYGIIRVAKEVTDTQKYLGKYYIFHEVDYDGKPIDNKNATYLEGKYKSQLYRWNAHTIAIDFYTTNSRNIIVPLVKKVGVKLKKYSEGDSESTYLFPEDDIKKVCEVVKPRIKGKNTQVKKHKKNVRLF